MNYVKHFDILGVNTAQIPCIELQGVPNSATEGAVGLLGMNMLSDDHEIYVCVAVNGSVYTWKPLKDGKDGVGIVRAELNNRGELLIILSDGSVNNVGVIKGEKGDPGEKGEQADLTKIKEKNKGRHLSVWFGDKEKYENLSAKEENTAYIFEDDATLELIDNEFEKINNSIDDLNTNVKTLETDIPNIREVVKEAENTVGTFDNRVKTLENTMKSVLDGTTIVGKASVSDMAIEDGIYRDIVDTYATKRSVELLSLTYTADDIVSNAATPTVTNFRVPEEFGNNVLIKMIAKDLRVTSKNTSFLNTAKNENVDITGAITMSGVSCSWDFNGNLGYGTITFNV